MGGGTARVSIGYRIIALPKNYENVRFADHINDPDMHPMVLKRQKPAAPGTSHAAFKEGDVEGSACRIAADEDQIAGSRRRNRARGLGRVLFFLGAQMSRGKSMSRVAKKTVHHQRILFHPRKIRS